MTENYRPLLTWLRRALVERIPSSRSGSSQKSEHQQQNGQRARGSRRWDQQRQARSLLKGMTLLTIAVLFVLLLSTRSMLALFADLVLMLLFARCLDTSAAPSYEPASELDNAHRNSDSQSSQGDDT